MSVTFYRDVILRVNLHFRTHGPRTIHGRSINYVGFGSAFALIVSKEWNETSLESTRSIRVYTRSIHICRCSDIISNS